MARIFPFRFGRSSREDGATAKKPSPNRTAALIRVGMVLLLCGVIGFSIYQVARHMTVGLSTLRTQEIVDASYVQLELYLFRDEGVLYAEGAGVTQYTVRDGERVGVGAHLGTAYAAGGLSAAEAADLQMQVNAYGDRIALLRELGGLGTPADARAEAEAVDQYYLALLDAATRGELSAANGYADQMLSGIGRYDILTGGASGGNTSIAAWEAARAELLKTYTPLATVRTDKGGYFYYKADGYESAFPYASALSMTGAEFLAMTERSASALPMGIVGKMVYQQTWYAAAYIPDDGRNDDDPQKDRTIEVFQAGIASGKTYRMTCMDHAGVELALTIERFVPDEGGVLVVFSSQDMPAGFDFSRKLKVETVAHTTGGYRIPEEAIVTLRSDKTGEQVDGVYILAGGMVEFRKIRIQVRREGYVIADTYEEIQALLDSYTDEQYLAATADGWSYLRLNDNIINGGNELYEGKMIS